MALLVHTNHQVQIQLMNKGVIRIEVHARTG
jgi:hypothetical protein